MSNNYESMGFTMIYVIVNSGMGSRILHKAKKFGIKGGTVLLGYGTVNSALLNFLSLYDERKEVILLGATSEIANRVAVDLDKEFKFRKPNHGIAFTIGACGIIGTRNYACETINRGRGATKPMYQLITTIVNLGRAEEVVEAATEGGAKGGTIIHARGSGVNETTRLFHMDIEPEKEVVLIISKVSETDAIVTSIREKLEIDKPGNGIIFVQDVNEAYGIFE
jgi:nitrogen regulatory protein PII